MVLSSFTAQKMKFSITDFFSKCEQIRSFLQIWSHLLMKSLMDNFIFCAVFELVNIKQELRMPSSNKIYKFITLLVGKISSIKHVNNKTGAAKNNVHFVYYHRLFFVKAKKNKIKIYMVSLL